MPWCVAALVRVRANVSEVVGRKRECTIIEPTHLESRDFVVKDAEGRAADDGILLLSIKPSLHFFSQLDADLDQGLENSSLFAIW